MLALIGTNEFVPFPVAVCAKDVAVWKMLLYVRKMRTTCAFSGLLRVHETAGPSAPLLIPLEMRAPVENDNE